MQYGKSQETKVKLKCAWAELNKTINHIYIDMSDLQSVSDFS